MLVTRSSLAVAALDRDLVIFDFRADRYFGLPGALASDVRHSEGITGSLSPEAWAVLLEAGFLIDADHAPPILAGTVDAVLGRPKAPPHLRITDWLAFVIAAVRTHCRLRRGRAARTYRTGRLSGAARLPDLAVELSRIDVMVLWLHVSFRCLPKSLRAALYLRSKGHEVDLVFGVRSYPFEAHCWLEQGGILLNDDPEHVRSYTPIVIGQP